VHLCLRHRSPSIIRRREENRIHSSESEAEPIVEDCAFAVDVLKLTIQATDRHEASRGLSEIAELLVMSVCLLFCVYILCLFLFFYFFLNFIVFFCAACEQT